MPNSSIPRRSRRRRGAVAAALALTGCSVFPPPTMLPSVTEVAEVAYRLPLDGGHRIAVPASDSHLTVLELRVAPPPQRELFERGRRYLEFADDVERVELHCRVRQWARPDDQRSPMALSPAELFPGAAAVRTLAIEPQP